LVKPDRPNEPDKQNKPVSASCEGVLQFFRWGEMVSPQPPLNADGPDNAAADRECSGELFCRFGP
jgi:hypothetical protein